MMARVRVVGVCRAERGVAGEREHLVAGAYDYDLLFCTQTAIRNWWLGGDR